MLTDHPHLQGLTLGLAMLAIAAAATPAVIDAARDLGHMPAPALAQEAPPDPPAPFSPGLGKILGAPIALANAG
jgi:hypothetical protein